MTKKLVSILIPAYNAEKWIVQTIESALAQIYPRKEIIIVDDGSTDRTYDTAKRFESSSLKLVRQHNLGACAARNKALSLAQGDFIQWLDSDDLLAHDKIFNQIREWERDRRTTVLFSCSFAKFYTRPQRADFIPNGLWKDLEPVEWLVTKFAYNLWMNPAVWLVSRVLAERAGGWDERLSLDDDGEYFSRLVSKSDFVRFVPDAKAYYRQWHAGSLSRTASEAACRSLCLSLLLSIGYLRALDDSDRTRVACIKLLQTWSYYFYPDKIDLLSKINDLAKELGGQIQQPQLGTKYMIIKEIFGWQAAKKIRTFVANTKLVAGYHMDNFACRLDPNSSRLQ